MRALAPWLAAASILAHARYDAQQTVELLAGRLRDAVELDAVGRTLVDVASRAVRPTSASVWLRGGSSR